MARTTRPTTQDYDFPVAMEELFTQDQKPAGFWGTRRTDTGQVLGVTSDKYGLLLNSDLINAAEGTFSDKKLVFDRKVFVARDGASMYARYDFPNKTTGVPRVGDDLGMRLTVRNSYDRTCTGDLELGLLRLLCLNGMKGIKRTFGFKQKHSRKLNLDGVADAVDRALDAFSTVGSDFGLLADAKIDNTIGDYILKNLESDKILSTKLREEITKLWLNPDRMIRYGEGESAERNLYTLYNCTTQHLTHRVESSRFEYADKVSQNVLNKFVKGCKEKKVYDRLTRIPTPKKGEILVTS
jgi:hypothetical protein